MGFLCPKTRKFHLYARLSSWVARLNGRSPEIRRIKVCLPERFTAAAVCSFGAASLYAGSPFIVIRHYSLYILGAPLIIVITENHPKTKKATPAKPTAKKLRRFISLTTARAHRIATIKSVIPIAMQPTPFNMYSSLFTFFKQL